MPEMRIRWDVGPDDKIGLFVEDLIYSIQVPGSKAAAEAWAAAAAHIDAASDDYEAQVVKEQEAYAAFFDLVEQACVEAGLPIEWSASEDGPGCRSGWLVAEGVEAMEWQGRRLIAKGEEMLAEAARRRRE